MQDISLYLIYIAIMLSIREGSDLSNSTVGDMEGGQELNDTTLFGEHIYFYDSGKLRADREYKEGANVGQWKEYDESG